MARRNGEEPLTAEEIEKFRKSYLENKCSHCGGVHARACPRVKRIVFNDKGTILEVEFWENWPTNDVVFPEELYEDEPEDPES